MSAPDTSTNTNDAERRSAHKHDDLQLRRARRERPAVVVAAVVAAVVIALAGFVVWSQSEPAPESWAAIHGYGSAGENPGELAIPTAIAFNESTGETYVGDLRRDRIVVYDPDGRFLDEWDTSIDTQRAPMRLAVAPDKTLHVTSIDTADVAVFDLDGNLLRTYGATGTDKERLQQPQGIAFDPTGRAHIADIGRDEILVYDPNGDFLFSYGATGGRAAHLRAPADIAFDPQGRARVADLGNNRIVGFDPDGTYVSDYGEDDHLGAIGALVIDPAGRTHIIDTARGIVVVYDSNGTFLFEYGTRGHAHRYLLRPQGITIDDTGRTHIAAGRYIPNNTRDPDQPPNLILVFAPDPTP